MLSSFNEECCINPGVCLDITPCFFFRFLYCTKSRTKYGRMIMTRSSELKYISHSVIIVAINYMCLFKTMFAFHF